MNNKVTALEPWGKCEISDERTRLGRKPGGGVKATLGNLGES